MESSIKNAINLFEKHQKERKKLKELYTNQNLYSLLLTNVQEGVIVVDENDKILFVNEHFCNSVDYRKEELLGKIGYQILVSKSERKKLLKHNANRLKGISEQYELT